MEIRSEIKLSFHFGNLPEDVVKHKNGYIFKYKDEYVGVSSDFNFKVYGNKIAANFKTNKNGSGWIIVFMVCSMYKKQAILSHLI